MNNRLKFLALFFVVIGVGIYYTDFSSFGCESDGGEKSLICRVLNVLKPSSKPGPNSAFDALFGDPSKQRAPPVDGNEEEQKKYLESLGLDPKLLGQHVSHQVLKSIGDGIVSGKTILKDGKLSDDVSYTDLNADQKGLPLLKSMLPEELYNQIIEEEMIFSDPDRFVELRLKDLFGDNKPSKLFPALIEKLKHGNPAEVRNALHVLNFRADGSAKQKQLAKELGAIPELVKQIFSLDETNMGNAYRSLVKIIGHDNMALTDIFFENHADDLLLAMTLDSRFPRASDFLKENMWKLLIEMFGTLARNQKAAVNYNTDTFRRAIEAFKPKKLEGDLFNLYAKLLGNFYCSILYQHDYNITDGDLRNACEYARNKTNVETKYRDLFITFMQNHIYDKPEQIPKLLRLGLFDILHDALKEPEAQQISARFLFQISTNGPDYIEMILKQGFVSEVVPLIESKDTLVRREALQFLRFLIRNNYDDFLLKELGQQLFDHILEYIVNYM